MSENAPQKRVIALNVLPPKELPAQQPYANYSFTFAGSPTEIAILFLRTPLLLDEEIEKLIKEEEPTVEGSLVTSVCMPPQIARDLAKKILELLPE